MAAARPALIQIKTRAAASGILGWGTAEMNRNQSTRYPRPCPLCSSAMIGEKDAPDAAEYVRFACLACGTTIEVGIPRHSDDLNEQQDP